MNNIEDYQYFLIIKKKIFSFQTYDPINGSSLIKEVIVDNYHSEDFFHLLEKFLEENIFKIEKELNNFIKKIFIIFESDSFIEVGSSIKHNLRGINFNHSQLNDTLIDIKNQLEKNSQKYEIIHMIINKYTLNGVVHKILPKKIDGDNLVIQVDFICLEKKIIENFKKIFSKYQISINKILCYSYLRSLNSLSSENISKIANETINGQNENEVLIVKKTLKNEGFFEKFFNFFK